MIPGAHPLMLNVEDTTPGTPDNGRKRFIVTDTLGLLLTVVVVTASVQDRDGAKPALLEAYLSTSVRFVFRRRSVVIFVLRLIHRRRRRRGRLAGQPLIARCRCLRKDPVP
jgi:hypothetical protein